MEDITNPSGHGVPQGGLEVGGSRVAIDTPSRLPGREPDNTAFLHITGHETVPSCRGPKGTRTLNWLKPSYPNNLKTATRRAPPPHRLGPRGALRGPTPVS